LLRQLYVELYIFRDFMVELIPAICMKADLYSYMQEAQEIVALARAKGVLLGEMIEDLESKGKLPQQWLNLQGSLKGLRKVLQDMTLPPEPESY